MSNKQAPTVRRSSSQIHRKAKVALLILAAPGILHFIIFRYLPLAGDIIAFQHYNIFRGILRSPWVGLQNFVAVFTYPDFYQILRNTLLISLYSIVFGFPAPLILTLLLNEVLNLGFKRVIQTLLYLPYFLSWVIIGGIFIDLLAKSGIVNNFLAVMGFGRTDFVQNPRYFRGVIVLSGIWKNAGWGMIIYLAAIAGVNPNLYEAAVIDGAGRWRQMWYVTIPSILPAIITLLLLQIGRILESNVEQVLIFLNPLVQSKGEVISTYVWRVGLLTARFSYTTAIGMFQSVVGFVLITGLNRLSKRLTGESIY